MRNAIWILALFAMAGPFTANAGDVLKYDFAAPYLQRSDKIYAGAGDSKDVNAATHVIDPWPPNVGNRNIPGNGERMVGAIERYRELREPGERFLDTYRRVGMDPFKEAIYG
jgi:hypothetical protein